MSEVSNSDLMGVLLTIKEDIGGLKTKADGHTAWMTKHVADDALLAANVQKLQLSHARQRGFMSALGVVGSALGAVSGYFVERWLRH